MTYKGVEFLLKQKGDLLDQVNDLRMALAEMKRRAEVAEADLDYSNGRWKRALDQMTKHRDEWQEWANRVSGYSSGRIPKLPGPYPADKLEWEGE